MDRKSTVLDLCPVATKVATTVQERTDAYRLRYEVYIAEQGKQYSEADARDRVLTDALDENGVTIVACRQECVVGTVRLNWFNSVPVRSRYDELLLPGILSAFELSELSIATRLAVACAERTGETRSALFDASYISGLARKTKLSFVYCRPALTRLFRRYGYREFLGPVEVLGVGKQHRLMLVLDDIDHLRNVQSPFLDIAIQHGLVARKRPLLSGLLGSEEHFSNCI